MKKKVSLSEIAKELGVSTTLVSLVLNGKAKEHRISAKMTEKVQAKAKEMNYVPNHLARGLRTGRTNTLGLIVADIANPFFSKLSRAVEDEADKHGLKVIFGSSDENAGKSEELIRIFTDRQLDGIIIAAAQGTRPQIEGLIKAKTPIVLVDRYFPDIDADIVAVDNKKAAKEAVDHLLAQGHTKMGMLGVGGDIHHLRLREEGFREGLSANCLEVREEWIKMTPSWKDAGDVREQLEQLLSLPEKPTALFLAKNHLGVYALEYLKEKGVRIPEDIALVSFDDSEAFRLSYVPMTAVEQPIERLGRKAVDMLMDRIKGKTASDEHNTVLLDTELLVRGSSVAEEV